MSAHQENSRSQRDKPRPTGESSQLPPRVLYGYVRVAQGDRERAAALKTDLMAFCQTYGYMIGTVFSDFGVEDSDVARPGFSSLLDVCRLVGSYGVVVPSRTHLSAHEETLAVLLRQIRRTGAKLIAIDEFEASLNGATSTALDDTEEDSHRDDAPC
ncbi:recombinase family protein [Kibdelosporangium aridum]|uniref:Resolvase, N terminal domain n=1 Tax=Kibdelosporangium aridum TaxID=2030 RepID=A0A1W2EZF1_KIBAR|nr:recombinase family protein [Kibdelosporangium aridum]SMD14608.1 Resolvase, N terminal domain [Kibdelosporangium aridum]